MTEDSATKHFMIRLEPEFHLALKRYALEEGKPLSVIVTKWIRDGWIATPGHEKHEKPSGTKTAAKKNGSRAKKA